MLLTCYGAAYFPYAGRYNAVLFIKIDFTSLSCLQHRRSREIEARMMHPMHQVDDPALASAQMGKLFAERGIALMEKDPHRGCLRCASLRQHVSTVRVAWQKSLNYGVHLDV
jgi:hypothetical protein